MSSRPGAPLSEQTAATMEFTGPEYPLVATRNSNWHNTGTPKFHDDRDRPA